ALPPECHLDENHLTGLSTDEAKLKIKRMEIHFCFIVGFEGAEERIRKLLSDYLKFDPNNIHVHIKQVLKRSHRIFSGPDSEFNHEKKKELRDFLSGVGDQLLQNEGK